MRSILILMAFVCFHLQINAQSVGIGTTSPNTKAALDITSTDKGVLFPRLTTAQRNAITNPPDGLHIFNTDERCLNYYDAVGAFWNCYCSECKVVTISITSNACKLDFYNTYAKYNPSNKYIVRIEAGVTISGCTQGDTALLFDSMPANTTITILNYGTIAGAGGIGGGGALESGCSSSFGVGTPPGNGGYAISTKPGVKIIVNNYGIVAGGGGGGGGSSKGATSGQGGGGGGGAGLIPGDGGGGGSVYQYVSIFSVSVCTIVTTAQPGAAGQPTIGGIGGAGFGGATAGGNGGARGQAGANGGTGRPGGAGGKAIGGGSGNSLTNIGSGQSFGVVD